MDHEETPERQVIIIGAGPAGLTAAYELVRLDSAPIVIEKADKVGGLARTEDYRGFQFDMGGHRFFTKIEAVRETWREILGEKFLRRSRLSRIYYNRKFFDYPLKPLNALSGLGLWQSILIVLSYIRWRIRPYPREDTFEQWVTNRFGRHLFRIFFKAYTEKVWGIPCSELKAEWAAQRIKDLSLKTVLLSMFMKPKNTIKTLIDEFDYPERGPGMMWNAVRAEVEKRGGSIRLNTSVSKIQRRNMRIESVLVANKGHKDVIRGTHFISSMPVTEFVQNLDPAPPDHVLQAAEKLKYRDFITVCLIVNKAELFSDNWIYVHDPEVRVGRIQNFKNWSPHMVPDPSKSSLGLEYFCNEGDRLWNLSDADLIELGKREIDAIGLVSAADVEDGCVFRVPKAYPIYDSDYRNYLAIVKDFVSELENFQTIGRNGLHRYNNQDHAMVTGMLSVQNLYGEKNNIWSINTDHEYLEEIREELKVAQKPFPAPDEQSFDGSFAKRDRAIRGPAFGCIAGLLLFFATFTLARSGSAVFTAYFDLLESFFPAYYGPSPRTSLGIAVGFGSGFLMGWCLACLRPSSLLSTVLGVKT